VDVSLLGAFSWLSPASWWAILQVVVGIGAVIFVHEMGHFLVAKACGVKCEKFYLGFDMFDIKIGNQVILPRALVKWRWGETEYGIGIIPLGGYVKMLGQDDNPARLAEERRRSTLGAESDAAEEVASVESGERPRLDPRSYQAKTVPQRMAIISAGVIMNLIFAVVFATWAFWAGVSYEPPAIGSTIPASPAWIHRLDGSFVKSIGGRATDDGFFSFNHLQEKVILDGDLGSIAMEVIPPNEDAARTIDIEPVPGLLRVRGAGTLPAIGVLPGDDNQLSDTDPVVPGQAASAADPPLQGRDEIVKLGDQTIASGFALRSALSAVAEQAITVEVRRPVDGAEEPAIDEVRSTIPPNPMRTVGLEMAIGPVEGVQLGSPAAEAGVQIGDELITINGNPIGDPYTLQARMAAAARDATVVRLGLRRTDDAGEPHDVEVSIVPRKPQIMSPLLPDYPLAVESLGLAFKVLPVVAGVAPNGSAAAAGIREGDRVVEARFVLDPELAEQEIFQPFKSETIRFDKPVPTWNAVHEAIQLLSGQSRLVLTLVSGSVERTVELPVALSAQYFQEPRGLAIRPMQSHYQAPSLVQAVEDGLNQTWDDATKVVKFLSRLLTGRLPVTSLGGPQTIAMAATAEASEGSTRLLLFLTLLSANLAVINFLPIPVLDGGHMMFLAYEGIFRRPVNERVQILLSLVGLAFIIGLMVLVIGLDIWRWS